MLALERRNHILDKLQTDKSVVVSQLSQFFNVSEETIRRDLDKLCKDGLVVKSHGGAILNENTDIDLPFNIRKKQNVAGKQKIAKIVETLIDDGDHIILDASTTAVFIAKAIKHKEKLTVITNSIEIIIELSDVSNWNIISTGGSLKEGYLALVGARAVECFDSYYSDKFIFSCKGIDMEKGITEGYEDLSQAKKAMIKSSKNKFLVADHTKFDNIYFSKITDLSDIDIVITDVKPEIKWLEAFEKLNIKCLYPED